MTWPLTINGHEPDYAADFVNKTYWAYGASIDLIGTYLDGIRYNYSRPSVATYRESSGLVCVAAEIPRLTSRGWLLEGAATNLLKYSNDPTQAAWSKGKCSATVGVMTGPDGKVSGFSLTEDSTSGFHELYQSVSATANAPYTISGFLKAGSRSGRAWSTKGSENFFGNPDLAAGTVAAAATTGSGVSVPIASWIEDYGNGWYRNGVTGKYTSLSSFYADMNLRNLSAGNPDNYAGDGASNLYGFGMQAEAGLFPTSYIPTGSAAVTRAKDSLWRQFPFMAQAITKRVKFRTAPGLPSDYQVLYHLDNNMPTAGGLYCDVEIYRNSVGHLFATVTYNLATTNIDLGFYPNDTEGTVAMMASADGLSASLNGGATVTVPLSYPWPTNLCYERLGHNMDATRSWFGYVLEDYTFLETTDAAQLQALSS